MQNEPAPEPIETPQSERPAAAPPRPAADAEADARIARMVAQRLNEAGRRSLRAERRYVASSLLMIACALSAIVTLPFFFDGGDPRLNALGYAFFAMQFILPVLTFGFWRAVKPQFDPQEIVQIGGVKAITPLIALLQNTLPPPQEAAVYALLILLLPRMKASDAALLTPADRRSLQAWLNRDGLNPFRRGCPPALRVAALEGLEQVGDSAFIPTVERLTRLHPRTRDDMRLRQAAIECLPALLANCGNVETARTLLRASQAAIETPEMLLRSAPGPNERAARELLRVAAEPLPKPAPPPRQT